MTSPVLCSKDQCTGCEACKAVCPEACIAMVANPEGFLCPDIDSVRCSECKQCELACPVLNRPQLNRRAEPLVFACWHKDTETREKSSSGGAFSALAENVLAKGGVVFGATYSENLHVQHTYIEKIENLDTLRRSKYVQSEIGNAFQQVRGFVLAGREVLFVGTPCQVAGLHAFLGSDYPNLISVDFICHGVPSPKVFKKYKNEMESKISEKLIEINFRDKRRGWLNNTVVGITRYGKQALLKGRHNSFYNAFIVGTFLRDSCYQCPVIGLPRFGSITIADFWGVQADADITQHEIDKGISLLMINDPDVEERLLAGVLNRLELFNRPFIEARAGNAPMCTPADMPTNRDDFFGDLDRLPYSDLAKKYLQPSYKRRLSQFIKENFSTNLIARARDLKKVFGR